MEVNFMRLAFFSVKITRMRVLSALALVGALAFSSCQSTSPAPTPSGPETRKLTITKDTFSTDSAKWFRTSDSGVGVLSGDSSKTVSVTLPSPLASGTVSVSLWSFGIRHTVIVCHAGGDGLLSATKADVTADSLARYVIARLIGLHKIDSAAYRLTKAGLVTAYARDLVEGVVVGFPTKRPIGIDSAAVVKAVLVYLASKHTVFETLFSAKSSYLGLDSSTVRKQILALVGNGISSADSASFFPPPPVRVKTAISLEHDTLVNKGAKIWVKGEFEADLSKGIAYFSVNALDSNNVVDSGVSVIDLPQPGGSAQWELSKSLSVRADSAKLGRHTLVVTAFDATKKFSATSRTTFVVLPAPPAPDLAGPAIELVAPAKLVLQVGTDTSSYLIKVKVSDTSGVASVSIGDTAATLAGDVWSRTVQLPVPGRTETFVVKMVDSVGNISNTSIYITRKSVDGAKGPSVTLLNTAASLSLPFGQKTVVLSWLVTDTAGVKSVDVNRQILTSTSDTFSLEVTVPASGDSVEFRLFAINKNLVGTENAVKVVRAKDAVAPELSIDSASWLAAGAFSGDVLVVPTATTSLSLKWQATDNHYVAAVTLNGDTLARGADSLYTWKIANLPAGITKATVIATDSMGNSKIAYAKLQRMDRVAITFSLDSVFIDSGYAKAVSPTPGATIEYSLDGTTWTALPSKGVFLTGSASIQFRGRAPDFAETIVTKTYVVKITPPPQAVGAVWNEFNWDDKLVVWQ